jgi:hypothetical protein
VDKPICYSRNGSLKTADTAQNSPDCKFKFNLMNRLGRELDKSLGRRELTVLDNKIYGEFFISS